ncbi:MAG: hypothetical protein ACM3XN_01730 [Chloroflexota bacterium]
MKRITITITAVVAALLAAVLVSGCRAAKPAVLADLGPIMSKTVLYLGKSGADYIVVDPAAGARYAVPATLGSVFEPLPPFAEISLESTDEGAPMLATGKQMALWAPIVAADGARQAAEAYPAALLDSLLYRSGSEYAIAAYAVKSSKVLSEKDGLTKVEFVADLKPAIDPFSPFTGSRWGTPGADGFIRDLRLVVDLYGNGGRYCLYAPDGELFAAGAPASTYTAPETLYQPVVPADHEQALTDGQEVEQVLYEDGTFSYITGVRFRETPAPFFEATLYRIDRGSGERLALFDLKRNTLGAHPLALVGRTLYLSTVCGDPYSEGRPGEIAAFDLDTGEYTVLLTAEAAVIGRAGSDFFIVGFAGNGHGAGIYRLNIDSGRLQRISDIPGKEYNPAYEGSWLQHFTGGRLYVLWPEFIHRDIPGPTYALFAIDAETGEIERQP